MTQKCSKRIQCQKMLNLPAMSLPEAAKLLFLSTSTIRYHIIRKRLRAFKWAGKWYVYKIDVETFKQWSDLPHNKKK
jgi:excisionase family DNA binding protein